jgi:hypothetical protein
METVIVLPLYVLLIAHTFWIGDLILSRQRLLTADRYAALAGGGRHVTALGTLMPVRVPAIFFGYEAGTLTDDSTYQLPLYAATSSADVRWFDERAEQGSLTMMAPPWIQGWLQTWDIVHGREHTVDVFAGMRGRDQDVGGIRGHVVLMRTPRSDDSDYVRNFPPWQAAELDDGFVWTWDFHYDTWWPAFDDYRSAAAGGGSSIDREPWYVEDSPEAGLPTVSIAAPSSATSLADADYDRFSWWVGLSD